MPDSPFSFFRMSEKGMEGIRDDHAAVYAIDLNQGFLLDNKEILSGEERERAQRFAMPVLSRRFTAAHVALKLLLGKWLQCSPGSIVIQRGSYGKPYVSGGPQFNLSHSGEYAAVIISPEHAVGADIEKIADFAGTDEVMEHFFPGEERKAILDSDSPLENFYRHWVLREAFVKALGMGLSFPLEKLSVAAADSGAPEIRVCPGGFQRVNAVLREWQPAEGYAGAVAEIQDAPSILDIPGVG